MQRLHYFDVGVQIPVQAVGQALFFAVVERTGGNWPIFVALFEAHIGKVVDGHLHFGL